jgi:hypothetical protein
MTSTGPENWRRAASLSKRSRSKKDGARKREAKIAVDGKVD